MDVVRVAGVVVCELYSGREHLIFWSMHVLPVVAVMPVVVLWLLCGWVLCVLV